MPTVYGRPQVTLHSKVPKVQKERVRKARTRARVKLGILKNQGCIPGATTSWSRTPLTAVKFVTHIQSKGNPAMAVATAFTFAGSKGAIPSTQLMNAQN